MDEWLTVGKIVAPQGLRGEVRVYPLSDFPERFLVPGKRWLKRPHQDEVEPIELLAGRYVENKNLYVLELDGVEDRDDAEALRGAELLVAASDRPHLEPGEFYVMDLIGMTVVLQADQSVLGVVRDVLSAGNDLLEVEVCPGGSGPGTDDLLVQPSPNQKPPAVRHLLIPFVKEIVPLVDLTERRLEITPPPGLLDL